MPRALRRFQELVEVAPFVVMLGEPRAHRRAIQQKFAPHIGRLRERNGPAGERLCFPGREDALRIRDGPAQMR